MSVHYVRPYVPGAVTTPGFIVVCIPGAEPVEVTEQLALKLTDLVIGKKYEEARQLLSWFSDTPRVDDADS